MPGPILGSLESLLREDCSTAVCGRVGGVMCMVDESHWTLTKLVASKSHPSSCFPSPQHQGYRSICDHSWLFMWVLRLWSQVLMFIQQILLLAELSLTSCCLSNTVTFSPFSHGPGQFLICASILPIELMLPFQMNGESTYGNREVLLYFMYDAHQRGDCKWSWMDLSLASEVLRISRRIRSHSTALNPASVRQISSLCAPHWLPMPKYK